MNRERQRLLSGVVVLITALALVASVATMVADYAMTSSQAAADADSVKRLEKLVKEDYTKAGELEEEWEKQTLASLAWQGRLETQANILIVSAIAFFAAMRWSSSLVDRRAPSLDKIVAYHAGESGGSLGRRRAAESCDCAEPCPDCTCDEKIDLAFVDQAIEKHGRTRACVIPLLQTIHDHYRYLPLEAVEYLCEHTDITPAQIDSVKTFFTQFRDTPVGRHLIKICVGTACHVAGAGTIASQLKRDLGIAEGTDTDPQREFTVEEVACMGCCTLAPVAQADEVTYGHLTAETAYQMVDDARRAGDGASGRKDGTQSSLAIDAGDDVAEIRVGLGSCCVAGGSGMVYEALERAAIEFGAKVRMKRVGCVGMCHNTPLVEVVLPGGGKAFYARVEDKDARDIIKRHFGSRGLANRAVDLLGVWRGNGRRSAERRAIELRDPPVAAFLGPQQHIATEHGGLIDPTDYEEYRRRGGFSALEECVSRMSPGQVVELVDKSGLRGRGGGGFPSGKKWRRVQEAESDKYVICNGDEGDPGAFMDRMIMESFPFRVIEGLAIAAFAVGASEAYIYVRAEYPLAVERLRDALSRCEDEGLLGDRILGSGFSLKISIMEGAGAFVCGEETALIASIEGRRGTPRLRPPYPAESGLWGKPTLVNNVETLVCVPWIIRNGAEEFAKHGTETSRGTKVFALAGKVERGGLIEVPMGVTIGQIVMEIGGGIKSGRSYKAVQIGGPSGGCVPANLADTPVDFEALAGVGAIMGSGGLVVLDDSDCMVDIARYFLSFTQEQSCGKCTYCRVGTRRMLDILDRFCEGKGKSEELSELEELASAIKLGSLCGLGKTAPNPVLSTLKYFREEYEAHLEGRCPAGKCKDLIQYEVTDDCIGCTLCAQHCPEDAIAFEPYRKHTIDADKCTKCDICRTTCPEECIVITTGGQVVGWSDTQKDMRLDLSVARADLSPGRGANA